MSSSTARAESPAAEPAASPAAEAEPATEALFRQFRAELFAYVRSRVDGEDVARDLVQTTFLKAHRGLSLGAEPDNPRAWLYQILKNLIVDARRRGAPSRASGAEPGAEPEAPEMTLESDAFTLLAAALPLFLAQLDEPYREALTLTELEGLSQAEAARRVGIGVSGMKSRVQRGRRLLFASLQRCCAFEVDGRGRVIECTPRAGGACC